VGFPLAQTAMETTGDVGEPLREPLRGDTGIRHVKYSYTRFERTNSVCGRSFEAGCLIDLALTWLLPWRCFGNSHLYKSEADQ
jgi:hypothetical protein